MTPFGWSQRIASILVMVLGALVILGTSDPAEPTVLTRIEVVHFDAGESELDYVVRSSPFRLQISVDSGASLTWADEPEGVPKFCVTKSRASLTLECASTYADGAECAAYCEGVRLTVSRKALGPAEDVSMTITLQSFGPLEVEVTPD